MGSGGRFVIIGAGAVGGYIGETIAGAVSGATSGAGVVYVDADPVVVERWQRRGAAACDPEVLGRLACDDGVAVLVTTPAHVVESIGEQLPSNVPVVVLSNGVVAAPSAAASHPARGIVDFNVVLDGDGSPRCIQRGAISMDRQSHPAADRLAAALEGSNIAVRRVRDIRAVEAAKVMLNASFDAPAAIAGLTWGEVLMDARGAALVRMLLGEAVDAARVRGLRPAAIHGCSPPMLERLLAMPVIGRVVQRITAHQARAVQSTMARGLRDGRRTEVEQLNGAITAWAPDLTPTHQRVIEVIRQIEAGVLPQHLETLVYATASSRPSKRATAAGPPRAAAHRLSAASPVERSIRGDQSSASAARSAL